MLSTIKGDVTGAVSAATITLPMLIRLLPETYKRVEGIIREGDRDRDLSGYLRITYKCPPP
jgi:hypothetical protein